MDAGGGRDTVEVPVEGGRGAVADAAEASRADAVREELQAEVDELPAAFHQARPDCAGRGGPDLEAP